MALSFNNNPLMELITVGGDALNNLYDVVINLPDSIGADISSQQLRVRLKGFTPPETSQKTYTVKYKGATLTRPSSELEIGQTFTLNFRLDSNYNVYKALLKLQSVTSNPAYAYATNALPPESDLATISVYALTTPIQDIASSSASSNYTATNSSLLFKYYGCWISKINKPQYKQDSSSALEIEATFNYLRFEDAQSGLL